MISRSFSVSSSFFLLCIGSFTLPSNLALPTPATSVQLPNKTNTTPKPVQSTLNQHFTVVTPNNSQQQQQQSVMTSPTITATPTSTPHYAAQQQPTGVNNISMAPVTASSQAITNTFQVNNYSNNNIATVPRPSSIDIPSQITSPITPTGQNHVLANDLLYKKQEDLFKLLIKIQPQPQQRNDNRSLPQSPISSPQQQQQHQNPRSNNNNNNNNNNTDTTIAHRNNLRLSQLAREISSSAMYGPACDEFLEWLQDVRAYNPANEAALMKCANVKIRSYPYYSF